MARRCAQRELNIHAVVSLLITNSWQWICFAPSWSFYYVPGYVLVQHKYFVFVLPCNSDMGRDSFEMHDYLCKCIVVLILSEVTGSVYEKGV